MAKKFFTKNLILTFALSFSNLLLWPQSFVVTKSDLFEGDIGKPVLYTKSGITVYQYDDLKKGNARISIFNIDKKNIVYNKVLEFKTFKYKKTANGTSSGLAIYKWEENKSNAALFIRGYGDDYKVTIDLNNGDIINEENIVNDLNALYLIEKSIDKKTGNYAFLFSPDGNQDKTKYASFDINVCNKENKIIHKINYDNINKRYQNAIPYNCLFEEDNIYIMVNLYNNTGSDNALYLSKYNITSKIFTHLMIEQTKVEKPIFSEVLILQNLRENSLLIKYNMKVGEKDATLNKGSQNFIEILFQPINKLDFTKKGKFLLPSKMLDKYIQEQKLTEVNGFMLDQCYVDNKGNIFTLRRKNMTAPYVQFIESPGQKLANQLAWRNTIITDPEMIAISYFDKTGNEKYGLSYPYSTSGMVSSVVPASYVLASSSNSNIIFLNNLPKNIELPLNEKHIKVTAMGKTNAIAIEISNEGVIHQYYLFDKPETEKDNRQAVFSEAILDKETNTYLVKMCDGKFDKTRAVWIKLK